MAIGRSFYWWVPASPNKGSIPRFWQELWVRPAETLQFYLLRLVAYRIWNAYTSAPGSWRDPAGESPAQVRCSARLVVSVALWKATTTAKRTQQSCGVGY